MEVHQKPLCTLPEPWTPVRSPPLSSYPHIPRTLRYCGAPGGTREEDRAPEMNRAGRSSTHGTSSFSALFLCASQSLSFSAHYSPSPLWPTPLLSGSLEWVAPHLGEDVRPRELPQPHQVPPLRFQPLLLCESTRGYRAGVLGPQWPWACPSLVLFSSPRY